ncbi:MAG: hypothetical protein ACD_79C00778G0002 [uncultured bacterium]|nr:MAG: hypothetical protein ACD_79C00778G0002 [uncultured bacterium]
MFEGAYTAIVTPFKNGKLDEETLKSLIDWQINSGITGIIPCGTTGESPTLSYEEHKRVIDLTVSHVNGRVKVIAGAGSNCTSEAIELAQHAKDAGADAALVITPYYNKPTQKGLFMHFETIAEEVDIPIILYNVPGRTGVDLQTDTICELSEIPGIVAIKEASGSVIKVCEIVERTNLTVLSGEDALNYPLMTVGAKGVISVLSNVVPDLVSKMVDLTLKGEYPGAFAIHQTIFNLSKKLFLETNPIPVKAALAMMGKISEELRLPLCLMSDDKKEILAKELIKLGIIKNN